jgi:coenzyme F420-reducing hydrogenase gamma subunit
MESNKKLVIGWFSFTCCEDSSIVLTEILNTKFFEWKKNIEFRYMRILKTVNSLEGLDIAFVEGASSSDKHVEQIKEIRANCKKLVAVGSCAVTGMPSGNRNNFDEETLLKYKELFDKFAYSKKVQKISDLVTVDEMIPGCPMKADDFIAHIDKYLVEFGIKNA